MLDLSRRKFLVGLGLVGVAPLVVKTPGLLMPIKAPKPEALVGFGEPVDLGPTVRIVAIRIDAERFGGEIPQRDYLVEGRPMTEVQHRAFLAPPVMETISFETRSFPMYLSPRFGESIIHVGAPDMRPGDFRVISVEPVEQSA